MLSDRDFNWRRLAANDGDEVAPGSRGRLRWVLAVIAGGALVVFARVASLELFYGAAYRHEAARPIERVERIPAARGRILTRDGIVLAYDRQISALAVRYRFLEEPPNPRWLEQTARRRLPRAERGDRERIEAERRRLLTERDETHRRLASLCGRTPEEFRARAAQVQSQVRRIAASVNERRRKIHDELANAASYRVAPLPEGEQILNRLGRWLAALVVVPDEAPPFVPIAVAEEWDHHVVFEDLSLEAVAEIEAHPERYPGARIVERRRRVYPSGPLAANLLGHLGPHDAADTEDGPGDEHRGAGAAPQATDAPSQATDALVGRMGIERRFESALRGQDGQSLERSNRSGALLAAERRRTPQAGRDVTLSIDSALQRAAESLLDQTLVRRLRGPAAEEAGGAVVAIDIETGDVLALASAPRFDPNPFAAGNQAAIQEALEQPAHPLFDRAIRMAIPPGSVFKALSAAALLESSATTPDEAFYCQGYLRQPNRQRCMIYRRHQRGHERVTLLDALAQSCNVYFFHFAEQMGPGPLVAWAEKFGFGQPTGIDLPDESPGELPTPETVRARQGHGWREGDTLALAIGQGELTATPLQIARLLAAIANGGRLPTPRVALRVGPASEGSQSPDGGEEYQSFEAPSDRRPLRSIEGLHPSTLAAVRRGLEQVVADPAGTGHRTVYCESVAIAGKTGTAETGNGRDDHAWFAGYAPAEAPRVAFVVALEHAGSGSEAAGPIAKRLVQKLESLGYFGKGRMAKNPLTLGEGRVRGGR